MPKIYKLFFAIYSLLWKIAFLFLRKNKRLKDGWQERNIPYDWLNQDIVLQGTQWVEKNPDKPFFGKKIESGQRLNSDIKYGVDLWLQAASGGEAFIATECLKALPKILKQSPESFHNSNISILITTWTRQGMQILTEECKKFIQNLENERINSNDKNLLTPHIQIRFAPLDTYEVVNRALDLANPRVCIMLETEIWPHFMLSCKEKEIPLYIINGRMAKTSFELYKIIAPVLNYIAPKQVLAMTNEDIARFSRIFPTSLVTYMPNIKFDKAAELVLKYKNKTLHVLDNKEENNEGSKEENREEKSLKLVIQKATQSPDEKSYIKALPVLFSKAEKTFLFASIRKEEENIIASLLWKLYPKRPNDLFIIVPRHLHRVDNWKSRFYDLGMHPIVLSQFLEKNNFASLEGSHIESKFALPPKTCLIWDYFGDLSDLYFHADITFIGGSFKRLGGQNFLEAIAAGTIAHVGPDLDNFLWALGEDDSLSEEGLLHKHENKNSLLQSLLSCDKEKRKDEDRLKIQEKLELWLESRHGGSFIAMEKILQDRNFTE